MTDSRDNSTPQGSSTGQPEIREGAVTRIARRRALPGHESQYENLLREMFLLMKKHDGFLGAKLIPPVHQGHDYQVVVNFASEAALAEWDASGDRREIFARMKDHAQGQPEHRRLSAMDSWFEGPAVAAGVKPAKWRMALVTWMGIWPLASLFIYFLAPVLGDGYSWSLGLPFLAVTFINTLGIVACMTWIASPLLTKLMKPFLVPKKK